MAENIEIPEEVRHVVAVLHEAGYEAYPVGGCVRDLLLARQSLNDGGRGFVPKDWDITTSAKPEEILALFPEGFYENKFLTVTVKTGADNSSLAEVEITTFRAEGKYTDKRHPDEVRYAQTLEEDLSRRDFTVNAMALRLAGDRRPETGKTNPASWVMDPFAGQSDLQKKLIRAVGDPDKRFGEDALRMMRAVRLSVQLDFEIEQATRGAIVRNANLLDFIAKERIRDELCKIIDTPHARYGIELLHELGLLRHIMPELEEGIGIVNRPKVLTIWEHNLKALEYGAKSRYPLLIRLTALLHDIGKPATKGPMKNGEWTFYGHDVVGAKIATRILERLHFGRHDIEKAATLIRWHLFKYDPDEGITDSSVRRLIRHVGADNMDDLVKVRICDRMGMGVPKPLPYRLRHFQFRVEKILREEEAPTPKKLKVNGENIMRILGIPPGPKIGAVLEVLLQEVIDDPGKNERAYLESRVNELRALSEDELARIADKAESQIELAEDERIGAIKGKYWVK
ncbi:MAG: HD domain-containing protein [Candidatus Sungbacteria bacterium]|nr:HD domain-containing protein [Candidatus Sungbacteria bacterium]